jgi:hypothetical protein
VKVYGIKRLRESEIGNDSSHQAHIGLFQDVIVSQGHQKFEKETKMITTLLMGYLTTL